jgi:hypothetical protein
LFSPLMSSEIFVRIFSVQWIKQVWPSNLRSTFYLLLRRHKMSPNAFSCVFYIIGSYSSLLWRFVTTYYDIDANLCVILILDISTPCAASVSAHLFVHWPSPNIETLFCVLHWHTNLGHFWN